MTFEDLDSWQKARKLVNVIYQLTRDSGLARDFDLCRQLQRAAVSVMSNIAEGFERAHIAEKLQAYNIARATCGEVRSLLYVIEDNYPPCAARATEIRLTVSDLGSVTTGLLNSTRRRLVGKVVSGVMGFTAGLTSLLYLSQQLWG